MDLSNKEDKKILFVIAHKDFRDEEYFITREAILAAGFNVVTASFGMSPASGIRGGKADVDILVPDAEEKMYDAIVIIGGKGISAYFDHVGLHDLVRAFASAGKTVAAICAAPVVLARAGVLAGKNATVWHTPDNMAYPEILMASDAVFRDEEVVADGKFVTASYPEASRRFGETVASMI